MRIVFASALLLSLAPCLLAAQDPTIEGSLEAALKGTDLPESDPFSTALLAVPAEVQRYNEHVVTLANPFFEGRLPGTQGMEMASRYMEHWWALAGLVPAFPSAQGAPRSSWRQAFELGSTLQVGEQRLSFEAQGLELKPGSKNDFVYLGLGTGGPVEKAPLVFVGYGIANGPNNYSSFAAGDDLRGKVALVLRWEPMNEAGKSLWVDGAAPWSDKVTLQTRVSELKQRGVAGILIANTPGAADARNEQLYEAGKGGRRAVKCPVAQLSVAAAERLIAATLGAGVSLLELRQLADQGRVIRELGSVSMFAELEPQTLIAENVGAILPGRGALKDEIVVIGAHLDHLGMGEFASRSGAGALHPGADDNASGSAALLLLADRLSASYAAAAPDANLRTLLFLAFSAEESGLVGSQYYCKHPMAPIEQHTFMINFDMIGRIVSKRLSVSGAKSGAGLAEFLKPYFAATPLKIIEPPGAAGVGSDHTPFFNAGIPVLFAIIANFHGDYHTPQDVSEKLNRVDAVHTVRLFHQIALGLAQRDTRFAYQKSDRSAPTETAPPAVAADSTEAQRRGGGVRFGVMPGAYDEDLEVGVIVGAVSAGSPAEKAGLKADDILISWNGTELKNVQQWMPLLQAQKPGDKVKVGVLRGEEKLVLEAVLEASAARR